MGTDGMPNTMDVIVFEAGGRRMALDLRAVEEVLTLGYITALPVVPESILGATNVRGRMFPVVALEPLFGMPGRRRVLPGTAAILLRTDVAAAVVPVDSVVDVLAIPMDRFEVGGQGSGPLVPGSFRGVAGSTPLVSAESLLEAVRAASAEANLRVHQRHEAHE